MEQNNNIINNNFNNNDINNNNNIYNNNNIKEFDITNSEEVKNYLYSINFNNKNCFDCQLPCPTHVSIPNGILLCQTCADFHLKNIPYYISYIREIRWPWDEYLLSFMERGGNGRLLKLFYDKKISYREIEKSYLYTTKIMNFYRLLLKSEVLCEEPPDYPGEINLLNPIDLNENNFPEFDCYQIYKGIYHPKEGMIKKAANYVKSKIDKETIVNTGISVGTTIGNGLKAVYNFSKPIVKSIGKHTLKGIGYACNALADQMQSNIVTVEDKNNNNNNNSTNDNNINNNNINYNNNNVDNFVFAQNVSFPTYEEIRAMDTVNDNNNNNINNNNNNINNNNINNNNNDNNMNNKNNNKGLNIIINLNKNDI